MQNHKSYRRIMDAVDREGKRYDLLVRLGLPRPVRPHGHPEFECEFELTIGDAVESGAITGSDELCALYLAMISIGSVISELRAEYTITWHGEPYTFFPLADDPIAGE